MSNEPALSLAMATPETVEEVTRLIVRAREWLECASDVKDVRELADRATAMAAYLAQKDNAGEAMNRASELRFRAERRIGEMLKVQEKAPGQLFRGTRQEPREVSTLEEQGLSKKESATYQRLADVPEEEFDAVVEQTIENNERLTRQKLLDASSPPKSERRQQLEEMNELTHFVDRATLWAGENLIAKVLENIEAVTSYVPGDLSRWYTQSTAEALRQAARNIDRVADALDATTKLRSL